jgi:ADP-ribose pyrophosphatase YjhB (NUDIX family)
MRESHVDLIEAHVSGICFHEHNVLVAKRTPSRKIYPGFWECGGGQVRIRESFEEAVLRQLKEELSVTAQIIKPFKTYEIQAPETKQKKIPGLRFVCRLLGFMDSKSPQISDEHTEWKLLAIEELSNVKLIPGLKEDILEAYSLYKQATEKSKNN